MTKLSTEVRKHFDENKILSQLVENQLFQKFFEKSKGITSYLIGDKHDTPYLQKDWDLGIYVGMLSLAPPSIFEKYAPELLNLKKSNRIKQRKNSSPYNLCPVAGQCQKVCIGDNGDKSISQGYGRIRKTILLQEHETFFLHLLFAEIYEHVLESIRNKKIPVIRLNGYSDVLWLNKRFQFQSSLLQKMDITKNKIIYTDFSLDPRIKTSMNFYIQKLPNSGEIVSSALLNNNSSHTLFEYFSNILFYDYTKRYYLQHNKNNFPENYMITYSKDKKCNKAKLLEILHRNGNKKHNINLILEVDMYEKLKNVSHLLIDNNYIPLIDGDCFDCRLADPINEKGAIIIQPAKGTIASTDPNDLIGFLLTEKNFKYCIQNGEWHLLLT